jgi:hypothetical protein
LFVYCSDFSELMVQVELLAIRCCHFHDHVPDQLAHRHHASVRQLSDEVIHHVVNLEGYVTFFRVFVSHATNYLRLLLPMAATPRIVLHICTDFYYKKLSLRLNGIFSYYACCSTKS